MISTFDNLIFPERTPLKLDQALVTSSPPTPLVCFCSSVKSFYEGFFYLLVFPSKVFSLKARTFRVFFLPNHFDSFMNLLGSIQKLLNGISAEKAERITKPLGKWKDFCFMRVSSDPGSARCGLQLFFMIEQRNERRKCAVINHRRDRP